MMRKIKDIIRLSLVSPEVLSSLMILAAAHLFPDSIKLIEKITYGANGYTVSMLIGAPTALAVWAYKLGFDLLNPKDNKKLLKQWPDYWMIRARIIFSWLLGLTAVVGILAGYFLVNNGYGVVGSLVIACFLTVSATSLCTIAYARLCANEILDANIPESSDK